MNSKIVNNIVQKAFYIAKDYLDLPSTEEIKNIDWGNIQSIVATIGMWIIFIVFSAFGLWLIKAIGLYKMATQKNDKFAFLSFIPYGSSFVMGRIIGRTKLFGIEIEYPELILPLLLFTMTLPLSASISTILFVFFYYGILYKIYKLKWKGFATVATILSLFVPIVQPFFLFFIRNM